MDFKVWAKHQVQGEVPDYMGTNADRERSKWVEKIHTEHIDNKTASNIWASKVSSYLSGSKSILNQNEIDGWIFYNFQNFTSGFQKLNENQLK